MVDNFVNEKGRIVESQMGDELFLRWDSLMKELYTCAIQYKKEWELDANNKSSATQNDLWNILRTIVDDMIGCVNGFLLQRNKNYGDVIIVYISSCLRNKDKTTCEAHFIMNIEAFFARKILEQRLKPQKLIEYDLDDWRKYRILRAQRRKFKKKAASINEVSNSETIDNNFSINEATSPNKPLWTDKHTLYIYKKKTGCHMHNHDFISATAVLTGQNNAQIKLNAEYCTQCKRFFMSYTVYEMYREKHGMLLGKIRMEDTLSSDFGEVVLSEFSPLKLCGYSVSMKRGLSSAERQYIISKVIELGVLKKNDVIRYLEHFITMNGKKDGNEVALSKWKEDLDFTLKYKIYDQQQHNIYQVKKY